MLGEARQSKLCLGRTLHNICLVGALKKSAHQAHFEIILPYAISFSELCARHKHAAFRWYLKVSDLSSMGHFVDLGKANTSVCPPSLETYLEKHRPPMASDGGAATNQSRTSDPRSVRPTGRANLHVHTHTCTCRELPKSVPGVQAPLTPIN